MSLEFDLQQVFDDDYLHFYEPVLDAARSDHEAQVIASLGGVAPGHRVVDLACGHGRLAHRLAGMGAHVVGVDLCARFLERARADARTRGVAVEYVEADMAKWQADERFDLAFNWFTSLGYADDQGNLDVLRAMHACLKPDGVALIEVIHGPQLLQSFMPTIVIETAEGMLVDRNRFDPIRHRVLTRRTIVKGGKTRKFDISVRIFSFAELRDWLLHVGFREVKPFDQDGRVLREDSPRMILRARR